MTEPVQTPPAEPAKTDPPVPATEPGTEQLGDAGKKALDAMKAERNAANAEIKKLQDEMKSFEPLKALAGALGVKPSAGKTDTEELTSRIAAMEKQARDAELRAMRLEVAAEKGLTPAQAARLSGSTRDELATDADALKALFPGASGTPGTPQPDPSQGSRGSVTDLEARLAKAVADKDVSEQIRLKTAIAASKTQ